MLGQAATVVQSQSSNPSSIVLRLQKQKQLAIIRSRFEHSVHIIRHTKVATRRYTN